MQGWRKSNEDAMIMETDIGDGNSLFAVFDGHGGEHVALFSKKHFVEILMAYCLCKKNQDPPKLS
jgi:serine/threonine protein phosphatase PrpC